MRCLASPLLLLAASSPCRSCPSSLSFLPEGYLSPAHQALLDHAVSSIRLLAHCRSTPYVRHGGHHRSADRPMGGLLVLPLNERRVPIADGFRSLLDAASLLPFLPDSRLRASALPPDAQCAVRRAFLAGERLPARRSATLASLRATAVRGPSPRLRPAERPHAASHPPNLLQREHRLYGSQRRCLGLARHEPRGEVR